MEINRDYPCNPSYYSNRVGKIEYIVIHYTGFIAPAINFCKSSQREGGRKASANYFVGYDGEVFLSVPDNKTAWHCGANTYKHNYCRNDNSIGIEMCCKNPKGNVYATDMNWYFEEKTIKSTIELTKALMAKHNIPVENVIRHYDVTGKICPAPYVNAQGKWNEFKDSLVKEEKEDMVIYKTIKDIPTWGIECVNHLIDKALLKGDINGELNLEYHMLRGLVINYRAGLYQ